jgi:ABC-2 type transport system permease protein
MTDDKAIRRYPLDEDALAGFARADAARDTVLRGEATVAVVVPEGWAESLAAGNETKVWLLADSSDPIGPGVVEALVQTLSADTLRELATARQPRPLPGATTPAAAATKAGLPLEVETIDVLGAGKASPVVSMYAAGIAVMFLLFSATGHAGSLIEERENQTLDRLHCSRLGMGALLVGKWLFLTMLGMAQIVLMFAWAQLVFGVDVVSHLPGFVAMTIATAAAAASLALLLATACRSRPQLNAASVIAILTMSALGGSMVPRYLMSESMQQVGKFTFNAWAIDGYQKLFWRNLPLAECGQELGVLGVAAIVMLIAARVLARRWEQQ